MEGESVQHEINILITSCVLTSGFSMPVQIASAGQNDSGALIHQVQPRGGGTITVALLPMHKHYHITYHTNNRLSGYNGT